MDKLQDSQTPDNNPIDNARKLEEDAEKKLDSFSLFFRKERNIEAADLFKQAANLYKINKQRKNFFKCIIKASKIYEESGEIHEAARNYLEGARVAKNVDPDNAISYYHKHLELSNNLKHGEIYKEIGEFLKELGRYEESMKYLNDAIDDFTLNNRSYSINSCLDNICRMYLNKRRYKDAGETFIKMAENIKISKDRMLFTALLCFIHHDPINAKDKLIEYRNQLIHEDILFIENCIDAIITQNGEKMNEILDNFRFVFKVKTEHMQIVEELRKMFSDKNDIVFEDELDLT